MNATLNVHMMVYVALMAALMAVGAFIAIPIGPVPIVLQNLFILLAGLLLGPRWGTLAVAIYLLAGALGLPVFAGGTGGIGRFAGPTGGYLIGFLPAVYLVGMIGQAGGNRPFWQIVGMVCGTLAIYSLGVVWLKTVTGMSFGKSLALGMYPFLPGDALKIAAAIPIARTLKPIMNRFPREAVQHPG